jgi:AcrR family transcriptional regulator
VADAGKPKRGRPALDVESRRRRILDAATECFLASGYDETSVESVALTAGVTKRTIYELVGDKEALFRAVCGELAVSTAKVRLPAPAAGMAVRDVLRWTAQTLLEHALEPATLASPRMLMSESSRFPVLVREVLGAGQAALYRAIAVVFESLDELGMVAVPDPGYAARLFYDVIVSARGFRATLGFEEPFPTEEDLEERLDIFMRGYLQQSR